MNNVKNRGQISHLLTPLPVKVTEEMCENAEWDDRVQSTVEPLVF